MINTAETLPPELFSERIINTNETLPPENTNSSRETAILPTGTDIGEGYVIHRLLDKCNGQYKQSDVYLAKKEGKTYAVKIYRKGVQPSQQIQNVLMKIRHPNISHIIKCGSYKESSYEIYEYYSEGAMDGILEETGKLTKALIKQVVIPSINNGLHELHKSGVIHCDIKPSNLFFADNKKRVVIGDYNISVMTNRSGRFTGAARGTPEYAPPISAVSGNVIVSFAYDYGSFGLTLCEAVMGRSLFKGMSVEEISVCWDRGFELPGEISGDIATLIKGLLNKNEEQRWGYEQVKRWCDGEYMHIVGKPVGLASKRVKNKKPLIFGIFDGEVVSASTLHQLAKAIKEHWTQAYNVLRQKNLIDFVNQFDILLANKISKLKNCQDKDEAVFKLLTYVEEGQQGICYRGIEYPSFADYVESLKSGKDETAKEFLLTGLLVFYLRQNEYDELKVNELEDLIHRCNGSDMIAVYTVCSALQGTKTIDISEISAQTLDDLIPIISSYSVNEIDELLCDECFIAWMNRMGYGEEMKNMNGGFY